MGNLGKKEKEVVHEQVTTGNDKITYVDLKNVDNQQYIGKLWFGNPQ